MEHQNANGQSPPAKQAPGVISLESQLEEAAAEIGKLFAGARGVDPERDEFGHARTRFYGEAVAIMKASAKVGQTIARMQGSKFEHNINVRRDPAAATAPSSAEEREESPFMWLDADTLWDWQNRRTYVLDPTRNAFGRPRRTQSAEGTPLLNSGGSNGNSGNSGEGQAEPATPGGPRIR
ncbi:MAG TPA: hypothetical protein VLC74_11780 [Rhizomicrobium sp.]|nr:hypothetical protein [Rhizomicrobium sp.]